MDNQTENASMRVIVGIKTMKLYTHIDRIKTELASRRMTSSIDPIALSEIDSMHYLGNAAIQAAVDTLKIDSSSRVLDVGSGFGGPARILASLSRCHVTALELQEDIHELGQDLTERCNLSQLVKHVNGDILNDITIKHLQDNLFDAMVSYLVFLHIPNKAALLNGCAKLLKANGFLFIEDFYCIAPLTKVEEESLKKDVFCTNLPSKEEYVRQLELSGFCNVQFIDMTKEWTDYVTIRLESFIENRDIYTQVHGVNAYSGLLEFYNAVATLFNGGNLGGVRIIARRK